MKISLKLVLFAFLIFTKFSMSAQQPGIVMTKLAKAKNVSILHEDDRIKLVTKAGQRIIGYFKIIDNNTIEMEGQKFYCRMFNLSGGDQYCRRFLSQ